MRGGIRVPCLDGVFNHSAGRAFFPRFQPPSSEGGVPPRPTRDWFYIDQDVLEGRRGIDPYPSGDPEGHHPAGRLPLVVEHHLAAQAPGRAPAACASSCSASPSTGFGSGSTAGGSDVPADIEEPDLPGRSFRRRVRAVRPDAYLVGEVWSEVARVAQPATGSTPLMNYPLGPRDPRLRERRAGFDQAAIDGQADYRARPQGARRRRVRRATRATPPRAPRPGDDERPVTTLIRQPRRAAALRGDLPGRRHRPRSRIRDPPPDGCCPGRRRSTTATSSGWRAGARPRLPARLSRRGRRGGARDAGRFRPGAAVHARTRPTWPCAEGRGVGRGPRRAGRFAIVREAEGARGPRRRSTGGAGSRPRARARFRRSSGGAPVSLPGRGCRSDRGRPGH